MPHPHGPPKRRTLAAEQQHQPPITRPATTPQPDRAPPAEGTQVHLMPMALRCQTGKSATPPRDPVLRAFLANPYLGVSDYVDALINAAVDGDPRVVEGHMFDDTARYLAEWVAGEEVLANLLALLCSVVESVPQSWQLPDEELVNAANDLTAHQVDRDMLMTLQRFASGEEGLRENILASREGLQAATLLAVLWIWIRLEEEDPDRSMMQMRVAYDPKRFRSAEHTAYVDSLRQEQL